MSLPKISLDNVSSAYFRGGLGAVKEAGAPFYPSTLILVR